MAGERIRFQHKYVDPIVLIPSLSNHGGKPAHARIRNVNSSSFEVQIEEWDYEDGVHISEDFHYLVMEVGIHQLGNGSTIEVGKDEIDHHQKKVLFEHAFGQRPIVFAFLQTERGQDAATLALDVDAETGFFRSDTGARAQRKRRRLDTP